MKEISFKEKEVVFHEGDQGRTMYEVLDGVLGVYTGYGTEDEQKLTMLTKGQSFGEMAVLESEPRSTTIVALSDDVKLREIDVIEVTSLFVTDAEFVKNIIHMLSHRIRSMTEEYLGVCKTIKEMDDAKKSGIMKSDGLIGRIKKYIAYSRVMKDDKSKESFESIWSKNEREFSEDALVRQKELCHKDRPIFREGDKADCMYYVFYGEVGIYSGYGTPGVKNLTTLKEGSFFGEMGLIEKLPRSATAIAETDGTYVEQIFEDDIPVLVEQAPNFVLMSVQHLSSRLRKLTDDYLKACRTIVEMDKAMEEERDYEAEYAAMVASYSMYSSMVPGTILYY